MSLVEYQEKLKRLVVNRSSGRASPHRLCLLLAVIDLVRSGAVSQNRFYFAPLLLERYNAFFAAVKSERDHSNPYFPFFHLAGALRGGGTSFWHLHPLRGRAQVLRSMSTARSMCDITENVAYATLDPELFRLLQEEPAREALAETVARFWLDREFDDLSAVVAATKASSIYENQLRVSAALTASEAPPPAFVRSPAFRRLITDLYDYRCAATGIRVVLPTGEALVEAAHIQPFAHAGDDDPRNGLALCPDMHWAMDKHLIAPGPDFKWHVSAALDPRIPDFAQFIRLAGQPLLLPKESRFTPKAACLKWRVEALRPA